PNQLRLESRNGDLSRVYRSIWRIHRSLLLIHRQLCGCTPAPNRVQSGSSALGQGALHDVTDVAGERGGLGDPPQRGLRQRAARGLEHPPALEGGQEAGRELWVFG